MIWAFLVMFGPAIAVFLVFTAAWLLPAKPHKSRN